MTTFDNTRVAMAEYEKTLPARNAAWDRATTDAEIVECVKVDTAAMNKVREAYYEDTKAFNPRANCMLLAYQDIRRIVPYPKTLAPGIK